MATIRLDREAELLGVIAGLRAELAAAVRLNEELGVAVGVLSAQIAELTARLGSNSTNSSKPPSSDGPGRTPSTRSLRGKSGRKPGGQPGHRGTTLAQVSAPDRVIEHRPAQCGGCGVGLAGGRVVKVEARQVFDLPEVKIAVTEHQLATVKCGCGVKTKADAPFGVTRQVQYGPNIAALATLLVNRHYVTPGRTAELLSDLTGSSISEATVIAMVGTAATVIEEEFKPLAAELIAKAGVVHADETGFRIDGKTRWVHSASTSTVAWIQAHDRRGWAAMKDIAILPAVTGILVRDGLASYDKLRHVAGFQLCVAHVMRELQAVTDSHHHPVGQWCWAEQAKDAFAAIIHDPGTLTTNRHLIISAITCTAGDPSPPGTLAQRHAALRRRLRKRLDTDYLRFATDPAVPPTNNPAEGEIRMVKVKTKVSGAMRTTTGANAFLAVRSYLSTALKHHVGYLDALTTIFTGQPWLPAQP